jgi:hypothetical protein
MGDLWDALQELGSLVGLATGLFVIWDRFFRHSPTAVLVTRPLIPGGHTKGVYLQVTNRADRPILLSWENGLAPGRFGIARDHSIEAIVVSTLEGRSTIVLDSGEVKELLVLRPPDRHRIDPENYVGCELFWAYAQPKLWKPDRRIRVAVPMKSLRALDPDEY